MKLRFNEAKATQVAALLLRLRNNDGRMNYLKLLKLMYLVDREALSRWGRPVSTDHHVSMDKGPVLSRVYNLITEEQWQPSVWSKHIAQQPGYEVLLTVDPGSDELSRAEEALIQEVFEAHGHKNRWALVNELHELPEWQNPHGSMIPIEIREILQAVGKPLADIAAIEQEIEADAFADFVLQPA